MKKLFLTAFAAAATVAAFAQDLTSKKGEPILPEAGDWAIGIDASPFLTYAGNLLNGNGFNSAPTWQFTNGQQTIIAKYFAEDKMAYRAIVRIGLNSTTNTTMVQDDASTNPNSTVEDKFKNSNTFIGLGLGFEKRRGKTRLQGYYGAQAQLFIASSKQTFTYGNDFTTTNTAPTRTNFGPNVPALNTYVTENKSGGQFGIGARAFIGAEYFFLPKISVGGEFGWGLAFVNQASGEQTTETWDFVNGNKISTTNKTGKTSSFSLDTDNNNFGNGFAGQLNLILHF